MTDRSDGLPGPEVRQALDNLVRERLRAVRARAVIPRAERNSASPLSASQQQIWVLDQMAPGSPAYLLSWALRLEGQLDAEALRLAWTDLVARHEILRTRYTPMDLSSPGKVMQTIDPAPAPGWYEVDLTHLPPGLREERARQVSEWVRLRPFDLATEQPLRVTLIRQDAKLHLMVVTVHHIACDGSAQLARELGELYGGRVSGRPARLPEPLVQYADFAAWESTTSSRERSEPGIAYWRSALAGVTELPLDRPSRADWRGGLAEVTVSAEASDAVRALAAAHHTSPFAVLLTAFHAMLGIVSGTDDVTVGLPVSLRTSAPELGDTPGNFANTVVVRSHPRGGVSFGELLGEVRTGLLGALDHKMVPFALVVDALNPPRRPGVNPLYQATFDMFDGLADEEPFSLPGLTVRETETGLAEVLAVKVDISLHAAVQADGRFVAHLEYAAAVIDEATATAWATCWRSVVEAGALDPDTPLSPPADIPRTAPVAGESAVAQAVAPDKLAAQIAMAWSEALGLVDPDPNDNFFDVGGDSISAVALAGRLRSEGLDVTVADIFAYQSVAELGRTLAQRTAAARLPAQVEPFALIGQREKAGLPADVVDAYPLTATQLGMLLEQRSQVRLNAYQDSTSYLISDDAPLDCPLLQRAAQIVVDRHEVLRTSFALRGYPVPLQFVHRNASIAVGATCVTEGEPEEWLSLLKEFGAAERRNPMDLARAPLIRLHAHARPGRNSWWLTITECHPILEGWSFHSMLMELLTVYRSLRDSGTVPHLESIPFRYADYVAAEARARESEESRTYWKQTVIGRSEPALPVAWQDSPHAKWQRDQYLVDLRDLDSEMRRFAQQTRTSLKAVLLSIHVGVMRLVAGTEDFFTGLVCDGRPEVVGADKALGMYLNTVPFRAPARTRTWGDLVRTVHDQMTELWPHRTYPMQLVQQEFGSDRLLNVFFNYLDFHQVDDNLVNVGYNDNVNEFGLHVFTFPGVIRVNADNDTVSPDAVSVLLGLYRLVAEELALGPDGPVDLVRARLASDQPASGQPVRCLVGQADDRLVTAVLPRLVTPAGSGLIAPGVTARVLGRDGLPLPRGVPGELWIDETACTDPECLHAPGAHGSDDSAALHRTGVAARVGLDGALELLGASELDPETAQLWPDGSADALLRASELINHYPGIRDSHLMVRCDANGAARLTIYLRAAEGAEVDVASVRNWLADKRLPRRHIPQAWIEVKAWPRHPDGTFAAELLPGPDAAGQEEGAPPWDKVFEDLLRNALDPAVEGLPANVADLVLADAGMDSLAMVGMLDAIERAYDITLPDDFPVLDAFRTPRTLWEAVARLRDREGRFPPQ